MSRMLSRRPSALVCLLMGLLSGCGTSGPELGTVSGTVTLDGQPLDGATVIFQPQVGKASFGRTDPTGKYAMRYSKSSLGALIGPHRVEIQLAGDSTPVEPLPAKYNRQSDLTADVPHGVKQIDFRLQSK